MKKPIFTTLTGGIIGAFSVVCVFAQSLVAEEVKMHQAELWVSAKDELSIGPKVEKTSVQHAHWFGNDTKKNVSASKAAVSDKWTKMGATVIPTADGVVTIHLRSNFARDSKRNVLDNRTYFRNLLVNGKPAGHDYALYSQNGAIATYSKRITYAVDGKKGEPLTITVDAKVPAKWDGTYTVDISKYANIPLDGTKGGLTAMKKLPSGDFEFKKMKFRFADGANGNGAINVSPNKPAIIDISGMGVQGTYVYVIGACSNDLNYTDHANANMTLIQKSGYTANFWLRKDRDFGTSDGKTKINSRCLRVLGGGSDGGAIFVVQLALKEDFSPIEKIRFDGEKLNIFAITVSSDNVSTVIPHEYDMSQWRKVDTSDLAIKDGSALDVSAGMGKDNAGRYGKIKIGKNGKFEFEKMPNRPVKFKGTNWRPGDGFGKTIKTREDIDELAKMMRKQGYNLVRWRISMRGASEFEAPYKLREYNKDLYDYFFYAMAREGVYSHFNLSSHDLGNPDFKWTDRMDVKNLMFFGDEKTRNDWRNLVKWELNQVNKYTGKKWKDDPSIVSTEYFNEIELGPVGLRGASARVKKFVDAKFVEFLKNKYKTFENWNAPEWKKARNLKSFDDVKMSEVGISHPDVARFIIESGRDFKNFCEKVVREEEGVQIPLHQHNCVRTTSFALLSAEAGDYTALNVYHEHPSAFMSVGSFVQPVSSISELGEYFRAAAAKRVAGRPMMLSEWQHCHWNPYKYEAGVLFPAYSALQGFDNLTVHDVAVLKQRNGLGNFEVANSPVFRANEFLAYSLFFRGDVKTSKNRVDIVYDKKYLENSEEIGNAMNSEQSKLALLSGFAIEFPSASKTQAAANIKNTPASLKLEPIGSSKSWAATNFASTGAGDKKFDLAATVEKMRKKGILPKDNITDVEKGVFQSDTGEITMRVNEKLIKVVTPNTEAVALTPETKNEKLGLLEVESTSTPAAVAITSVDGKPLESSRKMVVIYNTDNISTGFKVTRDMAALVARGEDPVLMRVGKVAFSFKKPVERRSIIDLLKGLFGKKKPEPKYALYMLKITGERVEKIPFEEKDERFFFNIDTSKTKDISPFFELVAE